MKIKLVVFVLIIVFGIEKGNILCQTVTIGNQVWTSKNLNVTTFRNGDLIPQVKDKNGWSASIKNKTPAWCYYNFNSENDEKYGKIYNWFAVSDIRGLAPQGFHIPSNDEWDVLIKSIGNDKWEDGKKLKSKSGWNSFETGGKKTCPNCEKWNAEYRSKVPCHTCKDKRVVPAPVITHSGNGSNSTGFSALPGGHLWDMSCYFNDEGINIYWWCNSSQQVQLGRTDFSVFNTNYIAFKDFHNNEQGCYVRCIQDTPTSNNEQPTQTNTQSQTQVTPEPSTTTTQPVKSKPVVDCDDVWTEITNPFYRRNNGDTTLANEDAAKFLDWIMTQTPGFLQSGGPYLGQCGLIYPTRPYVNPNKQDLFDNATLKRIAQQKISVGGTYKDKVDAWYDYILPKSNKTEPKTEKVVTNTPPPVEEKKTEVAIETKVKDQRLEDFYWSVNNYANVAGIYTEINPEEMRMTKNTCDIVLKDYNNLYNIFGDSFESTGYDRKEFAENQTKTKQYLHYCYSKFTKKYSDDPNFRRAMQLSPDWVVNVSSLNKNVVK